MATIDVWKGGYILHGLKFACPGVILLVYVPYGSRCYFESKNPFPVHNDISVMFNKKDYINTNPHNN